jgi:xanthine/uracil/vitamin C permease (AzgA family)
VWAVIEPLFDHENLETSEIRFQSQWLTGLRAVNYPIALAPSMGLNAFFAFTLVMTYKFTWQQGLAAVFCSGVLFFLISVFRTRQYLIESTRII